jgi:hypothetical protein
VEELTAYYWSFIVPMNDVNMEFSFDSYLPPKNLYKTYANQAIDRVNKRLEQAIPTWESKSGKKFIVHEKRYLETIKEDVFFDPTQPISTQNSGSFKSASTSSSTPAKSARPVSVRASKTPVKETNTSVNRNSSGGMAAISSSATATASLATPATPTPANLPAKPIVKLVLDRDVPYVRPVRDPAIFDTNGGSKARVYVEENQGEDSIDDLYMKVIARIRPLMSHETTKSDQYVVTESSDGQTIEVWQPFNHHLQNYYFSNRLQLPNLFA